MSDGHSLVTQLHLVSQEFVVRFNDAVNQLQASKGSQEAPAPKPPVDGFARGLVESQKRFQRLVRRLPAEVNWSDEEFHSALRELQKEEEQLLPEVQRLTKDVQALQREAEAQLCELTGELLGAGFAEPETARPVAADPPKSSGSCVRLQDLAQDRSRRFAEELEFVQCLANPSYVQWLATEGFFREPGFQRFLEYLTYWRRPQYVRYIVYPQCLAVLDLLLRPAVRLRLQRADVISILAEQLQHAWGQADEVPLRNSDGEEVQEAEEQMVLSAGPGDVESSLGAASQGPEAALQKAWMQKSFMDVKEKGHRNLSMVAAEAARKHFEKSKPWTREELDSVMTQGKRKWQDVDRSDLAEVSQRQCDTPVPRKVEVPDLTALTAGMRPKISGRFGGEGA